MFQKNNNCPGCQRNPCSMKNWIKYYKLKPEDCPCFNCLLKTNCSKTCNPRHLFMVETFKTYGGGNNYK
jgi:hypothetical protein